MGSLPDEIGDLQVAGCRIRWVAWGDPAAPGIVLVHGARAHWGWWRETVAAMPPGRRLVALDLSGHGDSGRRPEYTPALWGEEIAALCGRCAGGRALLAAHSMGGFAAIVAAARHPQPIAGAILVDVRLRAPRAGERAPLGMRRRPLRLYGSREEAVASFRLVPAQPVPGPQELRRVASESVRREGGSWRWKFDPAVAQRFDDVLLAEHLRRIRRPLAYLRATRSRLTSAATVRYLEEATGSPVLEIPLPGAHHHALLDQPTALAAAIASAADRLSDAGRGAER